MMGRTVRYITASEAQQKANWSADVAWAYALAGDLDGALTHARNAVAELRREPSGGMNIDFGWSFGMEQSASDQVVEILLQTGHADEAIAFTDLLSQPTTRPTAVQERHVLGLAGQAYLKAGRIDQARSFLVLATEVDSASPAHFAWGSPAAARFALGRLELEAGNTAEATRQLEAARAAVNPYELNLVWQIERSLAVASGRAGDAAGARRHYEGALNALESVHERLRPEEFRLRFGFDRSQIYAEYAALLAKKAEASGQQEDAVAAFQAAERQRTEVLSSLLAMGWSRLRPEALPEQVRREREIANRLSAKQSVLREQYDKPSPERDTFLIDKIRADVAQIEVEHARVLTALAQGRYRFQAPATVAASLAAPVAATLGPSRVLVEYLLLDDRSYAFVVSSAGVKVVPLTVGRARVRADVQHLTEPFRQLRSGDVDLTRLSYDTGTAYALYQQLVAPLRAALGSASELLIVPDDVLHVLPFEALVERRPRQPGRGGVQDAGWAEAPFLVRRYTISYLTSAAELLPVEPAGQPAPGSSSAAPQRLFVLANPTAGPAPAPPPAQDDPVRRLLRSAGFAGYLTPLPSAEAEAQRIARAFVPDASTIVTRGEATEAVYTSRAGQYDIVHFATHGVASDAQPLYSALVLAPDASTGSDGFLQAYEVLRTPLRASLVVLGGCDTALGGGADAGRGLAGLAAAFRQAGARSVMATLWTVDQSAIEMMAAFYGGLARGQSAPAALRQAKLRMLQRRAQMGKTDVSLAHPFFWAPFKLMGLAAR
jgi:CHAT domain-containing protein